MPLRDHFNPPLDDHRSWDELHGLWPAMLVQDLSRRLPSGYYAAPGIHLGTIGEVDVGALEPDHPGSPSVTPPAGPGGVAMVAYSPPKPLAELAGLPGQDEYEVFVYDMRRCRRLVAAVEIVSPSNKDRPSSREKFVGKCAAMLRAGVSVSVVDVDTDRHANLYAELMARLGSSDPTLGADPPGIYAATCRLCLSPSGQRTRLQTWSRPLAVGQPLPTLPLWLTADLAIPLDLEASYEKACADLGIA
jgi:hypothetical protein